jgi:glycosyltransferase involved in cell wall biosynthesis
MPTFNGAQFVDQAISSILDQTYSDLTLSISDDASTDGTVEIVRHWAQRDSRIKVTELVQNCGAWHNWSLGLEMAIDYRFFMWACQDDIWTKDWIEQCINALKDSKYAAACGRVLPVDLAGNPIAGHPSGSKSHKYMQRGLKVFRLCRYAIESEEYGKNNNMFAVYRTRTILDCDLWPKHSPQSQANDYLIVRRVLQLGRIRSLHDPILFKRVGSSVHKDESRQATFLKPRGRLVFFIANLISVERYWYNLYRSDQTPMRYYECIFAVLKSCFRVSKTIIISAGNHRRSRSSR